MLMLRFCWCYTSHISTQQPPGTRYASCDEDGGLGWGGVGWGNNVSCISTWTGRYAPWSSFAFHHFHMNLTLRSMTVICISTWTWCYALWSSFALSLSSLALHTTLFEFLRKIFNMNMLRSMTMLRNMKMLRHMNMLHSMTMLRKPSLEVCHRKRARRAILKYGNACALSSGGGSAQGKTWWKPPLTRWRKCEKSCGCPFWGWSDGRVVIPKVDGVFFDRFRMLKSGCSLWGRRNFDHFLTPVTLPAGYLWYYKHHDHHNSS